MRIQLRNYRNDDFKKINEFIGEGCWPLRHLLITERTVTIDDEVIGYGNVRLIPEETIILDHDRLSKRDKVLVLKELLKVAHRDTKLLNTFLNIYGFCLNDEFAAIMEKHFGYEVSDRKLITFSFED